MVKNSETFFDGEKYISSKQAALLANYTSDYIGQLCRGEKIKARRIGRDWFVSEINLLEYQDKLSGIIKEIPVKINKTYEPSSLDSLTLKNNLKNDPYLATRSFNYSIDGADSRQSRLDENNSIYDFDISSDNKIDSTSPLHKDFHLKELYKSEFVEQKGQIKAGKIFAIVFAHLFLILTKINYALANWIENRRYKKLIKSESRESRLRDTNSQIHPNATNLLRFVKFLVPIGITGLILGVAATNQGFIFDSMEKIAENTPKIANKAALYVVKVPAKVFETGFDGINRVLKVVNYSARKNAFENKAEDKTSPLASLTLQRGGPSPFSEVRKGGKKEMNSSLSGGEISKYFEKLQNKEEKTQNPNSKVALILKPQFIDIPFSAQDLKEAFIEIPQTLIFARENLRTTLGMIGEEAKLLSQKIFFDAKTFVQDFIERRPIVKKVKEPEKIITIKYTQEPPLDELGASRKDTKIIPPSPYERNGSVASEVLLAILSRLSFVESRVGVAQISTVDLAAINANIRADTKILIDSAIAGIEKRIPQVSQNPVVFLTSSVPSPIRNDPPQQASGISAAFGEFSTSLGTGGDFTAKGNVKLGSEGKNVEVTSNTWRINKDGQATGLDSISAKTLVLSSTLRAGTILGSISIPEQLTLSYFTATSTIATSTLSTGGFAIGTNQFIVQQDSGRIGIGTTSPYALFSLEQSGLYEDIFLVGDQGTSSPSFVVKGDGTVGIGTTTPGTTFSVTGSGLFSQNLDVNGTFSLRGTSATSTSLAPFNFTRVPTIAHAFSSWTAGVTRTNGSDATLYINPATAAADTNLFAAGVGTSTMFLIDREGDVFAKSITTEGSNTLSNTTASSFTVEGNTTLGDAIGDAITFNSGSLTFNNSATNTVQQAINAWSIATTSTAVPIFSIDSTSGRPARVGIGTTSPWATLAVEQIGIEENIFAVSDFGTSTPSLIVKGGGNIGIGTTTPGSLLSVQGGNLQVTGTTTTSALVATSTLMVGNTGQNFIVNAAGNVGIGTTSPLQKLSVFGSDSGTTVSDDGIKVLITNTNNTTNNISAIAFGQVGGDAGSFSRIGVINTDRTGGSEDQDIFFGTLGGGAFGQRMRITSVGNVGIGTVDPKQVLTVIGNGLFSGDLALNGNDLSIGTGTATTTISGGFGIGVGTTTPGAAFAVATGTASVNTAMLISNLGSNNTFVAEDEANDISPFIIKSDGTVGIGTTSPGSLLSVQGGNLQVTGTTTTSALVATSTLMVGNTGQNFIVNAAGNVGIGTSSPLQKLSIFGSDAGTTVNDDGIKVLITNTNNTTNNISAIAFGQVGGDAGSFSRIGVINTDRTGGSEDQDIFFGTLGGGAFSEKMRIISNGNVGIGTPSPRTRLDMAGDLTISGNDINLGTGTATTTISGGFGIGIGTTTPGAAFAVATGTASVNTAALISNLGTGLSFVVEDAANDTSPFVIDASGNLGIGTSSPGTLLSVSSGLTTPGILLNYTGTGNVITLMGSGVSNGIVIRESDNGNDAVKINADSQQGAIHFYDQGTEEIQLQTQGVSYFNTGGFLGIGSTTPLSSLALGRQGASGGGVYLSPGGIGIGTSTPGGAFAVATTSAGVNTLALLQNLGTGLSFVVEDAANDTTPFVIAADGNVGIGTTSPLNLLHIATSDTHIRLSNSTTATDGFIGGIDFMNSTPGDAGLVARIQGLRGNATSEGRIIFETRDGSTQAERMRIAEDGNIGIGTTSPVTRFAVTGGDVVVDNGYGLIIGNASQITTRRISSAASAAPPEFQVLGTSPADDAKAVFGEWAADAEGSSLQFVKSRNATIGSFTIVQNGDDLGGLDWYGDDGVDYQSQAAVIKASVDGAPGVGDMPGRLTFWTTPDGTEAVVERMRITNAGNVGIATTTPGSLLSVQGGNLQVTGTTTSSAIHATSTLFVGPTGNFLKVNATGNVGIGITDPGVMLDVGKSIRLGTDAGNVTGTKVDNLLIGGVSGADGSQASAVQFGDSFSSAARQWAIVNGSEGVNQTLGNLHFLVSTASATDPISSSRTVAMTLNSSGNIGIGGTTTPTSILAVEQGANTELGGITLAATASNDYRAMFMDTSGIMNFTGGDAPTFNTATLAANGTWTNAASFSWLKEQRSVLTTKEVLGILASTTIERFKLKSEVAAYGANADLQLGIILDEAHQWLSDHNATGTIIGYSPMRTASVAFRGVQLLTGIIDISNGSATFGGSVTADSFITSSADVAENYEVFDTAMESGDIVAAASDNSGKFGIKRASADDAIIGVVSTKPGITLGERTATSSPVALVGRVPVKVSNEAGPIMPGDKITLSTIPGIGALATTSGQTIGIALENFDGLASSVQGQEISTIINSQSKEVRVGKIMVFVNLGYSKIDSEVASGTGSFGLWTLDQVTGRITANYALDMNGKELLNVRSILSKSGLWSIGDDGKIFVQEVDTKRLFVRDQATFGSQDKRIGITIYDETTGEPYCLKVSNGATITTNGVCGSEGQGASVQEQETSTTTIPSTLDPSPSDTIPPTIQILGNNPANILVGSTYSDNGATVTDPSTGSGQVTNLGYQTYLNGAFVTEIQLDTSTTTPPGGGHSIEYRATDSAGNTGSATRVVNVVEQI